MELPKIEIEIKFSPELIITVEGKVLGRVSFEDVETMRKFIDKLKVAIGILVKEFKDKEEKVVKIK